MGGDCQVSTDYFELKSRKQVHGRPFVHSDDIDSTVVLNFKEEAQVGQKTVLAHYASISSVDSINDGSNCCYIYIYWLISAYAYSGKRNDSMRLKDMLIWHISIPTNVWARDGMTVLFVVIICERI